MGNKYKNIYYFVYVFILAWFLPLNVLAQEPVFGISEDNLLEQYLFPISSYLESGSAIGKNGAECTEYFGYNSATHLFDVLPPDNSCASLGNAGNPQKTTEGIGVYTTGLAGFSYNLTVSQEGDYVFKVRAANDRDNFSNLTNQQLGYIFDSSNTANYDSYLINPDKSLTILADNYSQENIIPEIRKYEIFRSLIFSVYLDGEKKGYVIIKNTDLGDIQEGELLIGNIKPGDHEIKLNFLTDYYFDFQNLWDEGRCQGGAEKDGQVCSVSDPNACLSGEIPACTEDICTAGVKKDQSCQTVADCPPEQGICLSNLKAAYNEFSNADLDNNRILDVNPVIAQVSLATTEPTTDVIGVRIYTNVQHKDALTWYKENVINASASVQEITVDGYKGVQDQRTVYVNAANLDEQNKAFFTNVYVIAYNQNAAPSTINIFNQMLANWVFNKNVFDKYPLRNEAELIKDKFRRDTIRLSDVFNLGRILENYKAGHGGKCPQLEAGTFVKYHSISTWPSWQATLGNQLGSALPVDPLNIMASEFRGQYDCQSSDPNEYNNCKNVCTRDANGKALTGCPADQQCHRNYCSICQPGYEPSTCWDEINLKFDKITHPESCSIDSEVKYSFNLGGSECQNNGAFVYQYASEDDGNICFFYNRFEYTEPDVCNPGECYFNDGDDSTPDCYRAGACLEYKDENDNLAYRNTYCYQGTWRNSCGDGFVQTQCGEACDPNVALGEGESWCDNLYGDQDWYTEQNVKASCSMQCELGGTAGLSVSDCGGFCGDRVVEAEGREQCDVGTLAAPLAKGVGGLSQTSQYMCSGTQGGAPLVKKGAECENYSGNWLDSPAISCGGLADLDLNDPDWVNQFTEDSLIALGGFSASYKFNITAVGGYNLQIVAANLNDNLAALSQDQVNYILEANEPGDNIWNVRGICKNSDLVSSCDQDSECVDTNSATTEEYCASGGLDIPLYGLIDPEDQKKYDLLRSLVFAVYLDGQAPADQKGFVVLSGTDTSIKQTGNIFIGSLATGEHTVYLKFVGDHYYLAGADQTILNSVSQGDPDATALDINPVLYSVSLFSPSLGVGNCQSYGGWCGDGLVQLEFGEQCDVKNYLAPKPEQTINIVKNPSFEGVFTPWQKEGGNIILDNTQFYDGSSSLRINSGTDTELELKQYNNFFKDKTYKITFRLKKQEGNFVNYPSAIMYQNATNTTGMKVQLGNLDDTWTGANLNVTKILTDSYGWDLYEAEAVPTENRFKFRINFNTSTYTIFYLDMVQILPVDLEARPQYQCGKDPITNNLCQFRGGSCGDGVIQTAFGEGCDDRVGMSCANNAGCGNTGVCDAGICKSISCNELCKSTYCGDGIIQRPNSEETFEVCDWKTDPFCTKDCRHIKMGGNCTSDTYTSTPCNPNTDANCRTCTSNLSCSIRNFGDTQKKCLGTRGATGCQANSDCILGYYCEIATGKCKEEISTYLRYHPDTVKRLSLPAPSPANTFYDINVTRCPDLRTATIGKDRYLIDSCTYITWLGSDNTDRIDKNWNYVDAKDNGCLSGTRLPTITELYSLLRQSNSAFLYADKETLKICANKCAYDLADPDYCDDCGDDNYLYWSSTCTKKNAAGVCLNSLAVNFKYGSIEEYPAVRSCVSITEAQCPADWTKYGNSCYRSFGSYNWDNAVQVCNQNNAHIVTINDAAENSWVINFSIAGRPWLGYNDIITEGNFVWSYDTSSYTNWYPGEPNNTMNAEDCVELYGNEYNATWNDIICSSGRETICEKAPILVSRDVCQEPGEFKVRCIKESKCGDGQINSKEGETCEFYKGDSGQLIEKEISGASCKDYGYDGGFLHCDPATCGYILDNCYLNSKTDQSCADICLGRKALACQSVGLGIDEFSDRKDADGQYIIADDNKFMDIDAGGNCVPKDITADACSYKFINREQRCLDTLDNRQAPYNSEYSYCNCNEATLITTYSCSGTAPINASLCAGDGTGLIAEIPKTAVNFCTEATKCEYKCFDNYVSFNNECQPGELVFVTNGTWNGNLGGIAGADAKCQAEATNKGLVGTFKAWISTDTSSPLNTFNKSANPYRLIDSQLVASNWNALVSGNLTHAINVTSSGNVLTVESRVWTNTGTNGATNPPVYHCNTWAASATGQGGEGNAIQTNSQWTAIGGVSACNQLKRLYCFRQ